MSGFKITGYKDASEVEWLKDIHVSVVDKYWIEITGLENVYIGEPALDHDGNQIGEIMEIYDRYDDKSFAMVLLFEKSNFTVLLKSGIPIEYIIFDKDSECYNNLV